MRSRLALQFEERLQERTRIAQDLHDTLLQGFLSASMQLHVADDKLSADSPAKPLVSRVLELMGQVIEEGRNAVRGLRSTNGHGSLNLEEAFSRVQQELAVQDETAFHVIVEGRSQPLHPIIRDEVYRIGHEALINAFRHSHAKAIEVEVEYSTNHLRLLISDDGDGIDSQVLRSGRDGHWGLSGMRERAERIGARLKVRSRATAGTEVELSVPGHVAFIIRSSERDRGWLKRLRRRKAEERDVEVGSEGDK
jgi:signal transduction histidine kinase